MAIRNLLYSRLLLRQTGLFILLLTLCSSLMGVIDVSLSDVQGVNGQEVELILSAEGSSATGIYSLFLKVQYDPAALELLDVQKGAALPESWSQPLFSEALPHSIASYGTQPLAGLGELLRMRFALIGQVSAVYPVQITTFAFNEDNPSVQIQSGSVSTLNRIPWLDPVPPVYGAENEAISFLLQGQDPQGLPLEIMALDVPAGAGLSPLGNGLSRLDWTPDYSQAGDHTLVFGIYNSEGYGDTLSVMAHIDPRIAVSIPFSYGMPQTMIDIPIYGEDFTGMGVFSIFGRIAYNPALLAYDSIVRTGTLSAAWAAPVVSNNGSQLTISLYGTAPLTGGGVIFYLRMQAIGPLYSRAYLNFNTFVLNEGNPEVTATGGFTFIGGPEPWFDAMAPISILEGETLDITLQAHDPRDLAMEMIALDLPAGAGFSPALDNSANVFWQSGYFDQGEYELSFRATNSLGFSTDFSVALTVQNVPVDPIVINPIALISFDEDSVYTQLNLFDIFDDGDLAVGDELSFLASPNPYLDVEISSGAVTINPQANWYGSTEITFSATDLAGGSISHSISIVVNPVNDPPYLLQALPLIEMAEDSPGINIDLSQYLTDVESDPLSYGVSGAENLQITFDGSIMSIIPEANWFGQQACLLTVTEINTPEAYWLELPFTVVVHPINDAPTILMPLPNVSMMYNTIFETQSMDLYFADLESELSYTLSGTTNIVANLITENRIQLSPLENWYGTEYLTVRATDDSLLFVEQSFRITVIRDYMMLEDFNHAGALPAGWSVNTVSGSANWTPVLEAGADYAMQIQNPNASAVTAYRLMSQAYNLTPYKNIDISFDYNLQGVNSAIFQYSLNGLTWTNVATLPANSSGSVLYSLAAAQQQPSIRFRWSYQTTSILTNAWRIDDFRITGIYGDFVRPSTITDLQIDGSSTSSVDLSWTPCTELYFDRYEIIYSLDSVINAQDPVWSIESDPALGYIDTSSTTITGLSNDTAYWFMIRGVDTSANLGLNSNIVTTTLNQLPSFHSQYPQPEIYHNNRTVQIGITAVDDVMLAANTLQYRADLNGNGIYDEGEVWTPIGGYSNAPTLEIRTFVTFAVDAEDLRYEFRIKDLPGLQYVYSGTSLSAGISDDYSLKIDTVAPTVISDFRCLAASSGTVDLAWSSVGELHFAEYEIYYANQANVDLDATIWNSANDPNLAQIETNSATITGLTPGQRYWFRILGKDLAGNRGLLSNEISSIPNSVLPFFSDPLPLQNAAFQNSRNVQIGTTIYDAYGIDLSRIHFRYDRNGNGVYDEDESWEIADQIQINRNDESVLVLADCSFSVDAEILAWEFRAWDIDGYGPAYSGTAQQAGIADDWYVSIDTISPATPQNPIAAAASESSIQLAWLASSDLNFYRYEVYYSTDPGLGPESMLWTDTDDPALSFAGSGTISTTITALDFSTRYYFKIRAVDLAGNDSWSVPVFATTHGAYAPMTPSNFRLSIIGNDVLLEWDPVLTDTNGNPIEIAAYLIYGSTDPGFTVDFGSLLDMTDQTFYVFEDIAAFVDLVFFRVSALDGTGDFPRMEGDPKSRLLKR